MKHIRNAARRTLLAGAALALGSAMLGLPVAVSARTLDEIVASKKLVIGVNPTLPPLGIFNDKNEIDGFDVDIAKKLGEVLGVKTEIVQVGSPDRIPFVSSGKIDAVLGAMTITAERQKVIDFTVPLHTEVLGVLTTKAKPYKDYMELNDPAVRLVEVRGATPVKLVQEKLPKAQLLLLDNYPDAVRAIAQGRADAMIDVMDFMTEHTAKYKIDWRIVDAPIDVYFCAIGVQKGNDALREKLSAAVKELHRNGYVDERWKKWFGGPMLHDPRSAPTYK
ncbi:transporter substrate-binding domain-containing protein [Variovorax sp. J22G21]|uniref:transporter substrate-binding domain-containing protein n=1 Tax=Variovorax fucosicus TaxID=3053517 RepID=UPI002577292A|nr:MULTISPECIES: transporter substrate-binding domain-containing protein [unclassified Variovorax]MDM0040646.1 transporter substrate-binding domain-containing protein [Variovorax sp. J22R193]MDM0062019.1 transporter substrate-binding domain-containing protein [Variovorax sp. J22G21]